MRKIGSWQEVLDSSTIGGKTHVLGDQNMLPPAIDTSFAITLALCCSGFVLVLFRQHIGERGTPEVELP